MSCNFSVPKDVLWCVIDEKYCYPSLIECDYTYSFFLASLTENVQHKYFKLTSYLRPNSLKLFLLNESSCFGR